jgi:YrbI family 3-deoxy-D-manno-octulosonate 8-phosphate phosphatase
MTRPKVFLCDVDGVLTDGGVFLSESGEELKKFYIPDGMGLVLMRKLGIKTGIITSENLKMIERRAARLKMDFIKMGATDKLALAREICIEAQCEMHEVSYIGDDVNDYALLAEVGFAACPSNAQPIIKSIEGIKVLTTVGGRGAVREYINFLVGESSLVDAWEKQSIEISKSKLG